MLKGENIICFAGEDWGTHNPLAKTHLMTKLAKRNRILFVESIGIRRPERSRKDLERVRNKLKKWFKGYIKINDNFYVVAPLAIPYHSKRFIAFINKILLIIQLRFYQLLLGFNKPILWICIPTAASVIGYLNEKFLIAHIFDRCEYVPGLGVKTQQYIRKQMDILISRADICFVAGLMILRDNLHLNPRCYFVDHGVDYDHFGKALLDETPMPKDIKKIPSPIVGYVGNIEKENIDYELFKHIARRQPGWNLVIIGAVHSDFQEFNGIPNIYLLGRKDYYKLPNYLKAFDVAIIPFKISEWIKAVSQPLKLREYLAAGRPVVSTLEPEEEKFSKLIKFSSDHDMFIKLIDESMRQNSIEKIRMRRDAVKHETWDERLATIENLVLSVMRERE